MSEFKNLGKFKQWTGERFGGAKVTLQTEDFQKLEQETENRREGYERIIEAVEILQAHLLKKKTSPEDGKIKVMPFEALGSCLYHYGTIFPEDSALGIALINLGQTETRIAALQEALAQEIREVYLKILETGLQNYKDYDTLRKKLASRRLDYDSKLNRLNKAKKEKPELEQEMQASRIKYEDTEHDLIQKMAYIQEFENEHRDALFDLVQVQSTYHNQAKELFETVKTNWGQGITTDACDMMSKVMVRDPSNDSYPSAAEEESSGMASPYNKTSSLHNQSPTSSTDDYRTSIYSAESTIAPNAVPARVPPPTNLPTRHSSIHEFEKYRKALFDFTGQNNDEISFKTGDIIAVIDEIDKGWWLGEMNSNRGIFPVNYTEEYIPLPPKDNIPDKSVNATRALRNSYHHHDENTLNDNPVLEPGLNNARRPPVSAVSSSSPVIPTLKSSLSRKRSNAIRAPPPPPPTARFSSIDTTTSGSVNLIQDTSFVHEEPTSYIKSNSSSLHDEPLLARSVSPPPPPPSRQSVIPEPYLDPIKSHAPLTLENIDVPCRDCDCHDYIENPFKPGQYRRATYG
ncbi:hypothetical protein MFLAVUS_004629 [Mucor flavus]|uniref:BAR-domain-containing protein n=1 Tax=Mucor flavus TaxID=439312 RepID=A0ABP9YWG6_9FUNG